jgi:hypothetical protein
MLRSKTLGPIALLVALAVAFAAPAASEPSAPQAALRSCPDWTQMYISSIQVRGVACPESKPVMARYTHAIIENFQYDWSLTIRGFHCDLVRLDYYGDSHRCTANDGRVIRFRRGT